MIIFYFAAAKSKKAKPSTIQPKNEKEDASSPLRLRRATRTKPEPVESPESESNEDGESEDTLASLPANTTARGRPQRAAAAAAERTLIGMGPPRAISTPKKSHTMNLTFGADISVIEAVGSVSVRPSRAGNTSRTAKK